MGTPVPSETAARTDTLVAIAPTLLILNVILHPMTSDLAVRVLRIEYQHGTGQAKDSRTDTRSRVVM